MAKWQHVSVLFNWKVDFLHRTVTPKPESCRIVYKEASGFHPELEQQSGTQAIQLHSCNPFNFTESRVRCF